MDPFAGSRKLTFPLRVVGVPLMKRTYLLVQFRSVVQFPSNINYPKIEPFGTGTRRLGFQVIALTIVKLGPQVLGLVL